MIKLPKPVLERGDSGDTVKALRNALKSAGMDCGTSDGDFEKLTEDAVVLLQSMKTGLKVDGIYNKETMDFLFETINT